MIGALAATLLAVGLLPPYGEGWKRRGRIVGINFVFLATDALGAFFSLLSLVAQRTFDILGGVMYIVWYGNQRLSQPSLACPPPATQTSYDTA